MTAIQPASHKPDPIACAAGCKRVAADEDAASAAGWEFLPISRRWRCLSCWRELQAVNHCEVEQP